jgi:Putative zinc-finger
MTAASAIKSPSRQPRFRILWNYIESITDYLFVDCEDVREALSARLDNEEDADDARQPIDTHLAHCEACARWYDTAAVITRRARATATVVWPDVSDAVLARMPTSGNQARPADPPALGAGDTAQEHESEASRRECE